METDPTPAAAQSSAPDYEAIGRYTHAVEQMERALSLPRDGVAVAAPAPVKVIIASPEGAEFEVSVDALRRAAEGIQAEQAAAAGST